MINTPYKLSSTITLNSQQLLEVIQRVFEDVPEEAIIVFHSDNDAITIRWESNIIQADDKFTLRSTVDPIPDPDLASASASAPDPDLASAPDPDPDSVPKKSESIADIVVLKVQRYDSDAVRAYVDTILNQLTGDPKEIAQVRERAATGVLQDGMFWYPDLFVQVLYSLIDQGVVNEHPTGFIQRVK